MLLASPHAVAQAVQAYNGAIAFADPARIGQQEACRSGPDGLSTLTAAGCSTTGEQRVLVVLAAFRGTPTDSYVAKEQIAAVFFSETGPSLNHYLRTVSMGKTWASGDVVGWVVIEPRWVCATDADRGTYEQAIQDAVWEQIKSSIDVAAYDRAVLVMPYENCAGNHPGSCPWFSGAFKPIRMTAAGFDKNYFYDPFNPASLAIHEFGHDLGLGHANSVAYDGTSVGPVYAAGSVGEYGDPFSVMGNAFRTNIDLFNAPERAMLGWFRKGVEYQDVTTGGAYSIAPLQSADTRPKALRIARNPGGEGWLWVEYRPASTIYDRKSPSLYSGALVHYEDPFWPPNYTATHLLDFTPSTPGVFEDAALSVGQSWSDPFSPLNIRVTSATASSMEVSVDYASTCVSVESSSIQVGSAGTHGSIRISAPASCAWQAQASSPWLRVTPSAGTGSGSLVFDVDANANPTGRAGSITIGRQIVVLRQAGRKNAPPVSGTVQPASGSGMAQHFSFTIQDADGYQDVGFVEVAFRFPESKNACLFAYFSDGRFELLSADESRSAAKGPIGGPALSNGACTVDTASAKVAGSGDRLSIDVALTFSAAFQGRGTVEVYAQDQVSSTGTWEERGSWAIAPIIARSGVMNAASFAAGGVAPGEILTIFGYAIGPEILASARDGRFPDTLGGVQVLFDEIPAPLLYVQATQLGVVAPYGLAGRKTANIVVKVGGQKSDPASTPVVDATPGIFTQNAQGTGTAAALNQDLSVNSTVNPAARGSIIVLYATGEGATTPAGSDGAVSVEPLPKPVLPVRVAIGYKDATVLYAGAAPGLIAGLMQVNAVIPSDLAPANAAPVVISVGGIRSQSAATIAIK